ncbi:NIPAL4 isoform 4, partial [Pongo abelii]
PAPKLGSPGAVRPRVGWCAQGPMELRVSNTSCENAGVAERSQGRKVPCSTSTAPPKKSCARLSMTSALRCPAMPPFIAGRKESGRTMASTSAWAWPSCLASSSAAASYSRRKASCDSWPREPLELWTEASAT